MSQEGLLFLINPNVWCGPAVAPSHLLPTTQPKPWRPLSFRRHAAKEVRGVISPILPTQETAAWLDQNEAASWLSLGMGQGGGAWSSSTEGQNPCAFFMPCIFFRQGLMTWKLFSGTLTVGNKVAVPYFSGEGVDYGALPPGFSSKFTKSL